MQRVSNFRTDDDIVRLLQSDNDHVTVIELFRTLWTISSSTACDVSTRSVWSCDHDVSNFGARNQFVGDRWPIVRWQEFGSDRDRARVARARPLSQRRFCKQRRDVRASESAIHQATLQQRRCEIEKVQRSSSGEDDAEQRIESGREFRAVAHRNCFPSRRAGALFVEDLDVAADSLDAGVDEEIDLESRGKHDEGHERDAPPSSSAIRRATTSAPQATSPTKTAHNPGRSALADGVAQGLIFGLGRKRHWPLPSRYRTISCPFSVP